MVVRRSAIAPLHFGMRLGRRRIRVRSFSLALRLLLYLSSPQGQPLMAIKFVCTACGKAVHAPESLAGKKGACPKCHCKLNIPSQTSTQPPTAVEDSPTVATGWLWPVIGIGVCLTVGAVAAIAIYAQTSVGLARKSPIAEINPIAQKAVNEGRASG